MNTTKESFSLLHHQEHGVKNFIENASISLVIDSYDAFFSDFDPRPFEHRALSDDFLTEAKKATIEVKDGTFEIRFLVPKHLKNEQEEAIIRDRLHHYFKKYETKLIKESKQMVYKGVGFTLIGFCFMLLASLLTHAEGNILVFDFLRILFEPSGWFLVWFGLDQIFYNARERKPEIEFYHKMGRADFQFDAY